MSLPHKIQTSNHFEDLIKGVREAENIARKGKIGATLLEDKIRMDRLQTKLGKCVRELRLNYFEFMDALTFAENTHIESLPTIVEGGES